MVQKTGTAEPNSKAVGMVTEIDTAFPVQAWLTANFAREWYSDALGEAKQVGQNSRRREIIFAVAFAESFFFEWVRDHVLQKNFSLIKAYFPGEGRQGFPDRLKSVVGQLHKDGLLAQKTDWSQARFGWEDFRKLVNYRNGLLHAQASRPETAGLPERLQRNPTLGTLNNMDKGWPTNVTTTLFVGLLDYHGYTVPEWLSGD